MVSQKDPNKLTAKQESFIRAYADPASETYNNAMNSALIAGYVHNTAIKACTQIVDNRRVKAGLEAYRAKLYKQTEVTRQEVIANARYLVNLGKKQVNGADIGRGNEQLGKVIGAFSEVSSAQPVSIIIQAPEPQPKPVLSQNASDCPVIDLKPEPEVNSQ